MAELVGRCPQMGHEITRDGEEIKWSCLCPGRADGVYASALGIHPVREPVEPGGLGVASSAGSRERFPSLVNVGKLEVADNRPAADAAIQ